jgi:phospholipid/cholesterol/gamma-HCH transport system substrate-binding protein
MVIAQISVFGVISLLVIGYAVFGLLRVRLTNPPFTVTVHLQSAGGIYNGAEVAYRGVEVGRVTSLRLHTSGVTIKLSIDEGTKIPDDSIAHIYDLSAVGEQYVDLVPRRTQRGGYLHDGSSIPVGQTTTPLETATVIFDLEQFVDSIDPGDVRTIGREGAAAFAGTGPKLRSILHDTTTLVDQLAASEDGTIDLLHNAAILLHGAAAHAGDFDQFAGALRALSATLARSTPTIKKFLDAAEPQTRLVNAIIAENGSAVSVLLGNLATLSDIQVARVPGLRSLLVAVPEFGRQAPTVVNGGTLLGAVNIDQDQQLCQTGVPLSNPLSGTRSRLYSSSCGTGLVRGAANSPTPGSGQSGAAQSAQPLGASARLTRSGRAEVGTYDPTTGLISTSDGKLVRLGGDGGPAPSADAPSWAAMLTAGMTG